MLAGEIQPVAARDASPAGKVVLQCYDDKKREEPQALEGKAGRDRWRILRAGTRHFSSVGSRISGEAGKDRGAVCAGRSHGRHGPPGCAKTFRSAEGAILCRKSTP